MRFFGYGVGTMIGIGLLWLAGPAGAQENLDKGKTPAQLFASNCAICHKSPQGLGKSGGLFGLESFLREHYTASKESASAIAAYIRAMDTGPARAGRRTAKGNEKTKADDGKKPAAKPGEAKAVDKKPDAKSDEPKSSDQKPADISVPEKKSSEAKPSSPAAGEVKPAEGKSEKSE